MAHIEATKNLAYGSGPRQQLDIYAPRNGGKLRPVVVFFYGGAWRNGSKAAYSRLGRILAAMGYVVAVPDYRLYPDVKFPAFVEDGAAALAWIARHADEFGGDGSRITLMGHSAGAHIGALLAFDKRYLAAAKAPAGCIKAFVGLAGPYDFVPRPDLAPIFAGHSPELWNPNRLVEAGAPPSLLIHGQRDKVVEPANSEKLAVKLQAVGSYVRLKLLVYAGHYLPLLLFMAPGTSVRRAVKRFLRATLAP